MTDHSDHYARWFDEIGLADLAEVGGKNASLGELRRALVPRGVRVPDGFAVTRTPTATSSLRRASSA